MKKMWNNLSIGKKMAVAAGSEETSTVNGLTRQPEILKDLVDKFKTQ